MSRFLPAIAQSSLPLLTRLDPERAHDWGLAGLKLLRPLWPATAIPAHLAVRCFGLDFAHPLGLAAGFDKNGDYLDALGALGFSHIELGTVTPLAQPGNPRPRMFRLPAREALVNRMGFNNKGVDYLLGQLAHSRYPGVRGISIGKNLTTPIESAEQDYVACLRKAYAQADYIAVNVSSPNTARLRELQGRAGLDRIVGALQEERERLAGELGRRVPLLVKIAPNLDADAVSDVAAALQALGLDGIIATNTSNDLTTLGDWPEAHRGGLSGAPLHSLSVRVIAQLRAELPAGYPIIGVGGIMNAGHALATLRAGATLLQVYTGFAYRGQALITEILEALATERLATSSAPRSA